MGVVSISETVHLDHGTLLLTFFDVPIPPILNFLPSFEFVFLEWFERQSTKWARDRKFVPNRPRLIQVSKPLLIPLRFEPQHGVARDFCCEAELRPPLVPLHPTRTHRLSGQTMQFEATEGHAYCHFPAHTTDGSVRCVSDASLIEHVCVCVCVCVLQGMARDPAIPVEDAWGVLGERGKGTCLQSGPKQAGVVSLACGGCAAYPSTRLERENTVLRTTHDEWAAAGTDREASGGRAGPAAKREMHRQCQSEGRTRGRITLCREAVVA